EGYKELVKNLARHQRDSDRLAVVRFGATVRVEKRPEDRALPAEWQNLGQQNRSDVLKAVTAALQLVPEHRPARFVLVSDGEFPEMATVEAARLAALRQVPIDIWRVTKPNVADVSVYDLQTPAEVRPGEPFQFAAWIQSSARGPANYELRRDGTAISRGTVQLGATISPVLLRDVIDDEGVHGYELVVAARGEDRVPQNNRARAVVTCRSQPKVLLVTRQAQGNLARVLDVYKIPHQI